MDQPLKPIMKCIRRFLGQGALDGKIDELKRKYQRLESKREDIQEELQIEIQCSSRKRPRKEVGNWISNVERTKAKVEKLEQEISTSRLFNRLLVMDERVDRLTQEITELNEQSTFERGLTLEAYDREGIVLLTKELIGETFARNKREILDRLMGGDDSVVGVYGMGGVGKTTLVMHIYNELQDHRGVNVSWITVSQNFRIHKLQQDIAKIVRLDISEEEDVSKRAGILAKALGRRKNLILILDDVWEYISLIDIGVCVGDNVWKLVLTSRSLEICRMMECKSPIKVEPLSRFEAWTLFAETLDNDDLLSDFQIKRIAESLVSECDGLPLGIAVMAGSMRGVDDIYEWSNTLEEIKEAKYRSDEMEFYDRVFLVLRYSYDRLKDPKVKECLLYCSLFPEDAEIERDELIEYLLDENLVDGRSDRESMVAKCHAILNKLENVCLLEAQTYEGKKYEKMHDLVRDMALKIAGDSPHRFLVQAGMGLMKLPNDGKWSEDLLRVSLMKNKIYEIPSSFSPKCYRLSTLLLQGNHYLRVIPDNFFVHMKMLSVLDLSFTRLEELPVSIVSLESLTALLLRHCYNLKHMPSLENLTLLRKLNLGETSIENIPKGIEKLTKLRYLNLDGCQKLKMIPDGLLPQLSEMEWFQSNPSIKLRGDEIASWRKIETFYGSFHDLDNLKQCARSWERSGPNKYSILVGMGNKYAFDSEKSVWVFAKDDKSDTFDLPSSIKTLKLEHCDGLSSLTHNAPLRKITSLKTCIIEKCNTMRHVICSCCGNSPFSRCLETLELRNVPMLTDLVERNISSYSLLESVPPNVFSSLKELHIESCHRLESLFAPTMLPAIRCIEVLSVWYCQELVEIVRDKQDKEASTMITNSFNFFPNLKRLDLFKLPKLKSICFSSIRLSDSLKQVQIIGCPKLMRITLLWDKPYSPTCLKTVTVHKRWWDLVEWKHPQTKVVLQPFAEI